MKRKPENDWWKDRVPGADGEPPAEPTPLQPLSVTRDTVTVVLPRSSWERLNGASHELMLHANYVEISSSNGERKVIKDRNGPAPRIIREADKPPQIPLVSLEEAQAKNLKITPVVKRNPGVCYEFEPFHPVGSGRKG
jgi:hypothetical protein